MGPSHCPARLPPHGASVAKPVHPQQRPAVGAKQPRAEGVRAKFMGVERNPTMFGGNRFKLAVFGSNCSSGRAATMVPERWQNAFDENVRLAQMADAAGIECMV